MAAKKICHITAVHPPFDVRIFYKECKALLNNNYSVTLIAPATIAGKIAGINIIALPPSNNRLYRIFILSMQALWLALKQRAAVYHFHDPELLPTGVLLKLMTRQKVIYDVHEDYSKQMLSKEYIPLCFRQAIAFLTRVAEQLAARCFDGVVAATDDIRKNFAFHQRAVLVRNFPSRSIFHTVKAESGPERQTFTLIYAGILAKIRGITEMVTALRFVPANKPVNLILCGRFDPPEYETEVKGLAGYEKVEYLGWVEPTKMPALLQKADVGLVCLLPLPNYLTALPTKMFEYMAAGLPVIVSRFPRWQEIVERNRCGLCVDPQKPEAIAEAIDYLMAHPDERRAMGERGRKAVQQHYNWETENKNLLVLYESILQS